MLFQHSYNFSSSFIQSTNSIAMLNVAFILNYREYLTEHKLKESLAIFTTLIDTILEKYKIASQKLIKKEL